MNPAERDECRMVAQDRVLDLVVPLPELAQQMGGIGNIVRLVVKAADEGLVEPVEPLVMVGKRMLQLLHALPCLLGFQLLEECTRHTIVSIPGKNPTGDGHYR